MKNIFNVAEWSNAVPEEGFSQVRILPLKQGGILGTTKTLKLIPLRNKSFV